MSITTKTGDKGQTQLLFNRTISKCDPRVEACGAVDELNCALGLARANVAQEMLLSPIGRIQQDLVALMGELATLPEDWPRYLAAGLGRITGERTAFLDQLAQDLEKRVGSFKDWAMPGANPAAATLDLARATCRRAERRVCALATDGRLTNPESLVYLNRLSDVLWLMARCAERGE